MPFSPALVLLPFLTAVLMPLAYRAFGRRLGWFAALTPALLFAAFVRFVGPVALGEVPAYHGSWVPELGLSFSFALDGLSLLFALLITGIGLIVSVYAMGYMGGREELGRFYLYIQLFMGAMLGVVTASNLLLLYFFWELTSVASFLLIGFWYTRDDSRYGALKALLITIFGGFSLLIAVILIGIAGGTYDINALLASADAIRSGSLYPWIIAFVFLGAFTKSAQLPWHIWLPSAMAAPTPVSAYLHSATMVKAGIYLVARLLPILGGTNLWLYTVVITGTLTTLLGAYLAIRQTDLKALLAFSTVSQLGLILPMFGLGSIEAVAAGGLHLLNHAAFKGALFLLVGIIDHAAHTRDIANLRGLRHRMPLTALLMGIAGLSMAGVAPFGGFVSKEMVLGALTHLPAGAESWWWLIPALTTAASALTAVYSLILIHRIHFGKPTEAVGSVHEAGPLLHVGPVVLVGLSVTLGIWPGLVEASIMAPLVRAVIPGSDPQLHLALWHGFNLPLLMSLLAVGAGVLGYVRLGNLQNAFARIRPRLHANAVYDGGLVVLDRFAKWFTRVHMTGFLRDYVAIILVVTAGLIAAAAWTGRSWEVVRLDLAAVNWIEALVAAGMIGGAIVTIRANRRLTAIASLGAVGMLISLLFVLLRAPDLALTQLMVEVVSLVLLMMTFLHLPELRRESKPRSESAWNAVVSVGIGGLVTSAVLLALGTPIAPSISDYFVEQSLPGGGGRNIVNVILVDFRGFDTLGEITVITLAGLAVFSLVRRRTGDHAQQRPGRENEGEVEG